MARGESASQRSARVRHGGLQPSLHRKTAARVEIRVERHLNILPTAHRGRSVDTGGEATCDRMRGTAIRRVGGSTQTTFVHSEVEHRDLNAVVESPVSDRVF